MPPVFSIFFHIKKPCLEFVRRTQNNAMSYVDATQDNKPLEAQSIQAHAGSNSEGLSFHEQVEAYCIIRFLVYCLGCVPENDLKGWCREM